MSPRARRPYDFNAAGAPWRRRLPYVPETPAGEGYALMQGELIAYFILALAATGHGIRAATYASLN